MATTYADTVEKHVYDVLVRMYMAGRTRKEMENAIAKGIKQAMSKFNNLNKY